MAFNIPVQTSLANKRPATPPTPWVRQPDWVSITSVNDTEIIYLVNDATILTYKIQHQYTGVGNMYIDWGDGTTPNTITSGSFATTSHTYVAGTGTPCSLGYDTYKITITHDPGVDFTENRFINPNPTHTGDYPCGLLEAWYGDGLSNLVLTDNFNDPQGTEFTYLQYIKCPTTCLHAGVPMYAVGCRALAKVDYFTSAAFSTNFGSSFQNCIALQSFTFPSNMVNITNLANGLNGCVSLYTVTLPTSLNSVTDMTAAFLNCSSLSEIVLPALPACTNFNQAFQGCNSLTNLDIRMTAAGAITLTSAFRDCTSLQYINMGTNTGTAGVWNCVSMFDGCFGLIRAEFPSNIDISSLNLAFNVNYALQEVKLPDSITSCTSFASCFINCRNLQSFTFPSGAPSSAVDFTNAFSTTYALTEITFPNSYTLGSMSGCFTNSRVRTVNLPANAQNSITTLATCFNGCPNLETVTMPTALANVTSLSSTFQTCTKLKSIVFPATMNLVTTCSATFSGCRSLSSVTMPTSMNALGNNAFINTFQNCGSLISIVMPATVPASTPTYSYSNCFSGCTNLEYVTLPVTQTINYVAASGIQNMFAACPSLKTVTNLDKLGNPSTASTNYLTGTNIFGTSPLSRLSLESADFTTKLASLIISGTANEPLSNFTSLRLRNAGAGQYAGTAPQINISYTALSQAALVQVFNDLPTVAGKSIDITGAAGAAALTAGERAIATGKGWTIIG